MTYFDDLLETQNQPDVEYIPLVEETDDAIEPKLNDGDVLGVLPLRNMVLFPGVLELVIYLNHRWYELLIIALSVLSSSFGLRVPLSGNNLDASLIVSALFLFITNCARSEDSRYLSRNRHKVLRLMPI